MFQKKINELFNDIPHVCGIADGILIAGFDVDGREHDARLEQVLQRCRQANLKLSKEKCLFRQTSIPFFSEVILRHRVSPGPTKVKAFTNILPCKTKRELQLFLDIVNNLSTCRGMQTM